MIHIEGLEHHFDNCVAPSPLPLAIIAGGKSKPNGHKWLGGRRDVKMNVGTKLDCGNRRVGMTAEHNCAAHECIFLRTQLSPMHRDISSAFHIRRRSRERCFVWVVKAARTIKAWVIMTTGATLDRHSSVANGKMNRRNNPEDRKS